MEPAAWGLVAGLGTTRIRAECALTRASKVSDDKNRVTSSGSGRPGGEVTVST